MVLSFWADDTGIILDDVGVVACDDCPCAPPPPVDCLACPSGFAPARLLWTTWDGIWRCSATSGPGGNPPHDLVSCNFNGAFVLDYDRTESSGGTTFCFYRSEVIAQDCHGDSYVWEGVIQGNGVSTVVGGMGLIKLPDTLITVYNVVDSTIVNCSNFSAEYFNGLNQFSANNCGSWMSASSDIIGTLAPL